MKPKLTSVYSYLIFAILLLTPSISYSQEKVSTIQTASKFNNVKIKENIAFAVSGWGLEAFDISDPTAPTRLSVCPTPGEAYDLDIGTNYAYVADFYSGLTITDISNPSDLKFVSNYTLPRVKYGEAVRATSVKVNGNYVYLSTYHGLYTIKIDDPYNPELMDRFYYEDEYSDAYRFFEATISGNRLYVTSMDYGLHIFDVSNPANLKLICNIPELSPEYLQREGKILYGSGFSRLITMDISNPDTAVILDSSDNLLFYGGDVRDMSVDNGLIAIPLYNTVWLADASNPQAIDSLCLISEGSQFVGCSLSDSNLIVSSWLGNIDLWDVSNPEYPLQISNYSLQGYAENIEKADDFIYSKAGDSSFLVIDYSNPYDPIICNEVMGLPKNFYNFRDAAFGNDRLFIANDSLGINYYNVRNRCNPILIDRYTEINRGFINLALKNNLLIASSFKKLEFFLPNETSLTKQKEFQGDSTAYADLDTYDMYLYGHSVNCFEIYDISDISNPIQLSTTCYAGYVIGSIAISDERAYISLGAAGLDIFDISDKTEPVKIKRWPEFWEQDRPPLLIANIKIFDHYLFLFNDCYGIVVLDISDQDNPEYVASFETPGLAYNGIIDSTFIYCADIYGIVTIKHDLIDIPAHIPEDHKLISQNYPNPFNSSTVIKYAAPFDGHVELDVYNILGQKVVNLVNADRKRGDHFAFWDGRNSSGKECASGIYFCRLKTGNYEDNRTMVLVR
jgi:hypothetical protein